MTVALVIFQLASTIRQSDFVKVKAKIVSFSENLARVPLELPKNR